MEKVSKVQAVEVWYKLLSSALKMPGTIVNREKFLRSVFENDFDPDILTSIIEKGTVEAGIDDSILEIKATKIINVELYKLSSLSFVAGLPGGFASFVTIPVDTVQYYMHLIILIQKLAYLYGFKQIVEDNVDESGLLYLTLFFGVMHGIEDSEQALTQISKSKIDDYINSHLEKSNLKAVIIKTAKWLGIRLVKNTTKKAPAKIVPILGGLISGGLSYISAKKSAGRLLYFLKK